MSNVESYIYPEAYSQAEYSFKELEEKTTIKRKTFDRFKSLFPLFYLNNSFKGKTKNKMFYKPVVYILCRQIVEKQQNGLSNSEIKKYLLKSGVVVESNENEKTESRKSREIALIKEKLSGKLNKENKESNQENREYIENLKDDLLNLKDQLQNKDKELLKKEYEKNLLNEKLKMKDELIDSKIESINQSNARIMLLEEPNK